MAGFADAVAPKAARLSILGGTLRRCLKLQHLSGTEEHEPDHGKDQDRKPGRDREQRKYRRPGLALACFGRGLDDPMSLFGGCHGPLNARHAATDDRHVRAIKYRGQRAIRVDVPGLATRNAGLAKTPFGTRGRLTPLIDSAAAAGSKPGSPCYDPRSSVAFRSIAM